VVEQPSGTVTFLFTDIEGSTRLAKALGDRWPAAIAEHQRLLREAFAASSGYEIDTQGDAFFIAFARARDAVSAAVSGQAALASHDWGEGQQLTVRMGVHTGEAQVEEGKYRGVAVHRAARICAAAHGGQILLSESTERVVEDEPLRDVHLRDLGRHKLKDIDRPEHLFQAAAEGLRTEFPPLRTERPVAWWRRRRVVAAAAAALAAAAAVAAFLATSPSTPGGLARIDSNSVGRIDPKSGRIVSEVPVGTDPTRLTVGEGGSLWVANFRDKTIEGIDASTGKRTVTVPDGALVADIAAGSGSVWALASDAGTVLQIDPRPGRAPNPVQITDRGCEHGGSIAACGRVAAGAGSVWATDGFTRLDRIDPQAARVVKYLDLQRGAKAVDVAQSSVWVGGAGGVTQVDPARVRPIQSWATPGVSCLAVGEGGVWAATDSAIVKIDPAQGLPAATIQIGTKVDAVAVGAGAVWAVAGSSGKLYEIDPQSARVVRSIRTGGVPTDVAVVDGSVWVSVA
jgi:class 3 adenylate cyclase/streptogramin lyase